MLKEIESLLSLATATIAAELKYTRHSIAPVRPASKFRAHTRVSICFEKERTDGLDPMLVPERLAYPSSILR